MDDVPGVPQKWVPELRRARRALTVVDEVGLALRAHRRMLGMSQRTYAVSRGLSRTMLARLEGGAGRMSLDTVVQALDGTGFALRIALSDGGDGPTPAGGATAVAPGDGRELVPVASRDQVQREMWVPTDLVARVRGGSRRFPAHRRVYPVTNPPLWWWMHEFFNGPSEEPKWYAPECHEDCLASWQEGDDAASGAA